MMKIKNERNQIKFSIYNQCDGGSKVSIKGNFQRFESHLRIYGTFAEIILQQGLPSIRIQIAFACPWRISSPCICVSKVNFHMWQSRKSPVQFVNIGELPREVLRPWARAPSYISPISSSLPHATASFTIYVEKFGKRERESLKNSNIKKKLLGEHPLHDRERDAKNYKYISINILTKCNNI